MSSAADDAKKTVLLGFFEAVIAEIHAVSDRLGLFAQLGRPLPQVG
ncbi:hypothetical protein ACWEN3_17010 [Streptomyces sp. NPDC004561]